MSLELELDPEALFAMSSWALCLDPGEVRGSSGRAKLVVGDPSGTWGSGYLNIMQLAGLFWLIQSEHQAALWRSYDHYLRRPTQSARDLVHPHCTQPPSVNPFSRNMLTWAEHFLNSGATFVSSSDSTLLGFSCPVDSGFPRTPLQSLHQH